MPLRFTDATLRDAQESLWLARLRTADILPVAERIDGVGYHSLDVWGGATFEVCLRYLDEDPWERLRVLAKHIKQTPFQMLLRGQFLVGHAPYPDDVVEAFVRKAVENGVRIVRVYDALNDVRNLEVAVAAARAAGAHVQGAVVYAASPVHGTPYYLELGRRLADLGVHSLCLKDVSGLLTPYAAFELVRRLKEEVGLPVWLHAHYIGGMGIGVYLKAAEAGVDAVDVASAPLAFGASLPPVETLVKAFQGSPYDTGLDLQLLFEIAQYFESLRKVGGFNRGVTRINDMRTFEHRIPGAMVAGLIARLEEQKALDRLEDVLREIPRVWAEMGYPPLVSPVGDIVSTQAVIHVLRGQRYKIIPQALRAYFQGFYGQPPGPLDPDVRRQALGDREPLAGRPGASLEPGLPRAREEAGRLAASEEDLLTYALFPDLARKYFSARERGETGLRSTVAHVDRRPVEVLVPAGEEGAGVLREGAGTLAEVRALISAVDRSNVTELALETADLRLTLRRGGRSAEAARGGAPAAVGAVPPRGPEPVREPDLFTVTAPMVGTFHRSPVPGTPPYVNVGDQVQVGQVLCLIETMKIYNEVVAEVAGEIVGILAENGQLVEYGQPLFHIRKRVEGPAG
ncbi:MAG: acetyl-CoA carboxylase biotin carboxyl carrier protein [Firmicutes bacterium]|nr:acetyl-CoA carboxylase biotin carboxyl carrier protein [Bacillota bacterium]